MTTSEQLDAVAVLLSKGWTQQAWARNGNGNILHWDDASATCFCIDGALRKVIGLGPQLERAGHFVTAAMNEPKTISVWNDESDRSFSEVIGLVVVAAQLARDTHESFVR